VPGATAQPDHAQLEIRLKRVTPTSSGARPSSAILRMPRAQNSRTIHAAGWRSLLLTGSAMRPGAAAERVRRLFDVHPHRYLAVTWWTVAKNIDVAMRLWWPHARLDASPSRARRNYGAYMPPPATFERAHSAPG